jgi:hypothetical protein
VHNVLANPANVRELFQCVLSHDEIVRMRASDALEKVCGQNPDCLTPYIDRLLTDVAAIRQPSVQRHVAQMIGELTLNEKQQKRAVRILKNNLETATDWIVLNYTLETFAQFVRSDDSLRAYFVSQLERHTHSQHKSVAKRASKLLHNL